MPDLPGLLHPMNTSDFSVSETPFGKSRVDIFTLIHVVAMHKKDIILLQSGFYRRLTNLKSSPGQQPIS